MKVTCPHCRREIPAADVNVAADTFYCRICSEGAKLSEALGAGPTDRPDGLFDHPPGGAWFKEDSTGFEVGAVLRTPLLLFLVPFWFLWSGGVFAFLFAATNHAEKREPGLVLFAVPFLIASLFLLAVILCLLAGRTTVSVRNGRARIFTGVGTLGVTRRFPWSEVTAVREEVSGRMNTSTMWTHSLVLEGARRVRCGRLLRDERRYFLLRVLQRMLEER